MISFFKRIFIKKELIESRHKSVVEEVVLEKVYSIDELIQSWREPRLSFNRLNLNEGVTDEVIINFQRKLMFIFPGDFISFYKQANGFLDGGIIGDFFSIWPLDRILQEFDKSDNKNFIPFCDYSMDSHRIGF